MLMPYHTPRPTTSAALPWPTQDRSWRLVLRRTRGLVLQAVPYLVALAGASMVDDAPETITILGEGFVPGGQVEVLLYDHAGEVIDAQWDIATTTNSLDHAGSSSIRPGTVSVVIETPCGPSLRLRAWDSLSARWSDWLTYDPTC